MTKILLVPILVVLASCVPTEPEPDKFTAIAEEWQGANIQEMIRVWGDPKIFEQARTDGEDGVARWTYFFGGGAPSSGSGGYRMRCDATAYFDSNGFIFDIEVVSQRCTSRSMDKLRRP